MSYTTTIPAGKIEEADLIALVEQVRAITKVSVSIKTHFVITAETVFVITAETVNASSIFDSLLDSLPADQTAVKKNGKAKATKKANGATVP